MSVFQKRVNGVLTERWVAEVKVNGKSLKKEAGSEQEAREREAELKALRNPVASPETSQVAADVTLSTWADKWAGMCWLKQKKSIDEMTARLKRIDGWLGGVSISQIDALAVLKLRKYIDDAGSGTKTQNRYLACLSKALKFAKEHGMYPGTLPTIKLDKEEEGRERVLTLAEQRALLGHLQEPLRSLVRLTLLVGGRRAEMLSITPRNLRDSTGKHLVDLEAPEVWLWFFGKADGSFAGTKNGTDRRIYLGQGAKDALKVIFALGMPTDGALRWAWWNAAEKMGLGAVPTAQKHGKPTAEIDKDDEFVFHALRHTCASRLANSGIGLKVVMKIMGHKDIKTTLKYVHEDEAQYKNASDVLEKQGENKGVEGSSGEYSQGSEEAPQGSPLVLVGNAGG